MKKSFKSLLSVLLMCAIVASLGCSAYAADYTSNKSVLYQGTEVGTANLFADFADAYPGDSLEQNLVIDNASADSDYVKVYLRAIGVDEESDDDIADFIHQFDLVIKSTVSYGATTTVFDSTPYSSDDEYRHKIHQDILLGTVYADQTLTVNATLSIPTTVGNDYASKAAKVHWVLTIVELNGNTGLTVTETPSAPLNGKAFALGEKITYTVKAENTGNVALNDVTVNEALENKSWTIKSLPAGESVSYTVEHIVTDDDIRNGTVNDTVTADGTADNPDITEPVVAEPAVTQVKTQTVNPYLEISITPTAPASGSIYAANELITYTIVVTNTGNVTVSDISLLDSLTNNKPNSTFTLKPGESYTFKTQYTVTSADVTAGKIVNTATASGTAVVGNTTEGETSTTVTATVTTTASATVYTKASLLSSLYPKTGDDSNLLLWAGVMTASAVAICAVAVILRRKRS